MIATCVALVAAVMFGLAAVFEQRANKQVPQRAALAPRLVLDLLRRPVFLAAIGVNIVGSLLQILALHLGSLALVQPILVLDLLFAVVIAAVMVRRGPPDWVLLTGVVCCTAGIAGFLAAARPHGGTGTAAPAAALPLAAALTAVLAGCLAAARWGRRALRPLWLAAACGVDFGVNAFLLKVVPDTLPAGFGDPLRQWPLYMLVIVTPLGFLLNQNAFQAGTLIAPVLAVITIADPLVSIGAGVWLLNETVAATPLALAGQVVSLAVMTGGIVALAHRAPQAAAQPGAGPAARAAAVSPGVSHACALCIHTVTSAVHRQPDRADRPAELAGQRGRALHPDRPPATHLTDAGETGALSRAPVPVPAARRCAEPASPDTSRGRGSAAVPRSWRLSAHSAHPGQDPGARPCRTPGYCRTILTVRWRYPSRWRSYGTHRRDPG